MQYTFEVKGMTCGHCERAVIQAVHEIDSQASVQVDRAQNKVEVQSTASADSLLHAISEEGYETRLQG